MSWKFFVLVLFIPYLVYGATNYSGFLSKGLGAKSSSLGGAYTAVVKGSDSIYWNPSSLSTETSIFYSKYFNEVDYIWIRSSFENFGIGYMSMSIDDIMYTNQNAETLGSFTYKDEALFVSYKYKNFGINFKGIHQKAIKEYYGFGIDMSVLYKFSELSVGLMIQDLIKSKIGTDVMITRYNLGLAYNCDSLLLSSDLRLSNKKMEYAIGCQLHILDNLRLIGGINNSSLSFGLEIDFETFRINYSYQPHLLNNINEFDFSFKFL